MYEYTAGWGDALLWTVIIGFILAFLVAFGMGANDCANSYGTVVGSGVLKLWQAYVLATIFEALGAVLLGYKVTDTMRKSIVTVSIYDAYACKNENSTYDTVNWATYENSTNCTRYTSADFIMGELGALAGTAFWLLVATIFHFPVSTTHSAVGATVGFSLVLKGADGIHWMTIVKIVISWVVSPAMAGLVSVFFYLFIKFTCLKRDDSFDASLKMLPFFYWFALTVNLFSILYDLKFDQLAWWHCMLISLGIGTGVALFMRLWGCEFIRKRVLRLVATGKQEPYESVSTKEMTVIKQTDITIETDGLLKRSSDSLPAINGGTDSGVGVTPFHASSEPTTFPSTTTVATDASSAAVGNAKNGTAVATALSTSPKKTENILDASSLHKKLANGRRSSDCATDRAPSFTNVRIVLRALKNPVEEHPLAMQVFNYLQIMSACFLSFSHGSNDTANAVGPIVGLWLTYKDGDALKDTSNDPTLEYIILFGAASMIIGLWVLGHKVIKTIGTKIVNVTPPSGFAMELGTAFTVLIASKIGIPVSTTHCAVGAVVSVGWMKSHKGGVSWKTFRNIAIAWIITLPVAGAVSALVAFMLNRFIVHA